MLLARVLHLALWKAARPRKPPPPLAEVKAALVQAEKALTRLPLSVGVRRIPPVSVLPPPPTRPPSHAIARRGRDEGQLAQEINGCKMLLLEIIRRAAYDWVLYRDSTRLVQKSMAEQSFRWLFLEEPGSAEWDERMREEKYITSFVAICEGLDLDPNSVRGHIRKLTPKNVMSVGRPAEYRRRDVFSAASSDEDVYSIPGNLVDLEPTEAAEDDQQQY